MAIKRSGNIVLGYHGCDKSIIKNIVLGKQRIVDSVNDYDWLGSGQYFWEADPNRALDWAIHLQSTKHSKSGITTPAVIGAVIDLGMCLDLVNSECIDLVKKQFEYMKCDFESQNKEMPENKDIKGNTDLLNRKLDCAVIKYLHLYSEIKFDTVRAMFPEGKELYKNAGFKEKTHVQICVVNPDSILGYFIPRPSPQEYNYAER
jgi:hypothetical protein